MSNFKDRDDFIEIFHRYNKDKPELSKYILSHGTPIRLFVSKEKVAWRFSDGYMLEITK